MGHRATALPTHKAKARWQRSAAQARVKRARQERKLAKARGVRVEQQNATT